jgi:hypothetical protein
VGDQQHGTPVRIELPLQLGTGVQPGAGVKSGQRLVEQEQRWIDRERSRQRHPLGLTSGQLPGLTPGTLGEADPVEPSGGVVAGGTPAGAVPAEPEGDVVQSGQVREEQVVLEHDTDRTTLGGYLSPPSGSVEVLARQGDVAGSQRFQTGERAQRGGLSGAVGPEQGDDLAGGDVQPDVEAEATTINDEVRLE